MPTKNFSKNLSFIKKLFLRYENVRKKMIHMKLFRSNIAVNTEILGCA